MKNRESNIEYKLEQAKLYLTELKQIRKQLFNDLKFCGYKYSTNPNVKSQNDTWNKIDDIRNKISQLKYRIKQMEIEKTLPRFSNLSVGKLMEYTRAHGNMLYGDSIEGWNQFGIYVKGNEYYLAFFEIDKNDNSIKRARGIIITKRLAKILKKTKKLQLFHDKK